MNENDQAYNDARYHLTNAFNLAAPNGGVQRAFVNAIHELERDGISRKEMLTRLTGLLYDGLAYGNWIGQNP